MSARPLTSCLKLFKLSFIGFVHSQTTFLPISRHLKKVKSRNILESARSSYSTENWMWGWCLLDSEPDEESKFIVDNAVNHSASVLTTVLLKTKGGPSPMFLSLIESSAESGTHGNSSNGQIGCNWLGWGLIQCHWTLFTHTMFLA